MSFLTKIIVALTGAVLLAPATAAAAPGRPALASPAEGANVQAVPAFTWDKVKRADRYEFQLAADATFGSIVGKGSFQTRNTAATIEKSLPDGTYFWRVRAINPKGDAGRWARRSITKSLGDEARADRAGERIARAVSVDAAGTPVERRSRARSSTTSTSPPTRGSAASPSLTAAAR